LRTIGRFASIGIIASLVLSAALATWLKYDDARELADFTTSWVIYFVLLLAVALIALGVIILVWLCGHLVLRNRGDRGSHV